MEALSGGRSGGVAAPRRGAALPARVSAEVPRAGAAFGAGEVRRGRGRALRSDAGGGTFSLGRPAARARRDATALDAHGRIVEPGAPAAEASSAARAQRTFWRTGADGRQLSPLAGGARAGGLPDRLADDATNTTLAQLGEQETIWAVADALRAWIERYGVPLALYVDWKNLYKRPATPRERLRGEEPITQFGRMCAKLGIELIAASSPQAKGRIERMHGTHQDRLVKKLRRREIRSHPVANVYLQRNYLPEHNERFARRPARSEDYHRSAPRAAELDRVFRLESERVVSEDGVVRYENRYFQLPPQRHSAPVRGKALVCEGRHGQITIEYRGRSLGWREIAAPTRPKAADRAVTRSPSVPIAYGQRKWTPPADHPWKQAAGRAARRKALREAAAVRASLAWPSASP